MAAGAGESLAEAIAEVVNEAVENAVQPLLDKIVALEQRPPDVAILPVGDPRLATLLRTLADMVEKNQEDVG